MTFAFIKSYVFSWSAEFALIGESMYNLCHWQEHDFGLNTVVFNYSIGHWLYLQPLHIPYPAASLLAFLDQAFLCLAKR